MPSSTHTDLRETLYERLTLHMPDHVLIGVLDEVFPDEQMPLSPTGHFYHPPEDERDDALQHLQSLQAAVQAEVKHHMQIALDARWHPFIQQQARVIADRLEALLQEEAPDA